MKGGQEVEVRGNRSGGVLELVVQRGSGLVRGEEDRGYGMRSLGV